MKKFLSFDFHGNPFRLGITVVNFRVTAQMMSQRRVPGMPRVRESLRQSVGSLGKSLGLTLCPKLVGADLARGIPDIG